MEHFKVIALNNEYWTVVPTAEHLAKYLDRNAFPYDTNWEIYKLYKYDTQRLCQHLTVAHEAHVEIYADFPYICVKFALLSKAEDFKNTLEKKFADQKKEKE